MKAPPLDWMESKCAPLGPLFRWRTDWRIEIADPVPTDPTGLKLRPIKEAKGWPSLIADWKPLIDFSSGENQVPRNLVASTMAIESGGDWKAESPAGALGLMQLLPSTAQRLAGKKLTRDEILEPDTNVRLGAKYLKEAWDKYDANIVHVGAYYNAGGVYCGAPCCAWVKDPVSGKRTCTAHGPANEWNVVVDCSADPTSSYPNVLILYNNRAVSEGYAGIATPIVGPKEKSNIALWIAALASAGIVTAIALGARRS